MRIRDDGAIYAKAGNISAESRDAVFCHSPHQCRGRVTGGKTPDDGLFDRLTPEKFVSPI